MNVLTLRSNWTRPTVNFYAGMLFALLTIGAPVAQAADMQQKPDSVQVMEAFEQQANLTREDRSLDDKQKHLIMFALGVPLLILLLATGALGIAMAVYGKQVFLLHMICAGLTVTLAVVHVIVGLVWFYPF